MIEPAGGAGGLIRVGAPLIGSRRICVGTRPGFLLLLYFEQQRVLPLTIDFVADGG